MTKEQALREIKQLRDRINDEADCSATAEGWENRVCDGLDRTADILEFPKPARSTAEAVFAMGSARCLVCMRPFGSCEHTRD